MAFSFDQIGQVCATFLDTNDLTVGAPCCCTGNNTVTACQADDRIAGVVVGKQHDLVAVAVRGFVTVPYSGSAPACGFCTLAADGDGNVAVGGTETYLVVSVNKINSTVTFLL